MLKEQFKLPQRSWRAPGVKGILAMAPHNDPAFDVDGLPDPFSVYFPVFITNLYTAAIYITALLIAPPAGWTDSEQNLTTCSVGVNVRTEKSNATRAVMATPANETITIRYNYRTGSYAGPIIGFDDFAHAIYWESILAGTIVDTDDFENPPGADWEGWTLNNLVGTLAWTRSAAAIVHGIYAMNIDIGLGEEGYLEKTLDMVSGTRAYLFGFYRSTRADYYRVSVVSAIETLEIVYVAVNTWRRVGVRLTPAASNLVRIYMRQPWGSTAAWSIFFDYFRWVRY